VETVWAVFQRQVHYPDTCTPFGPQARQGETAERKYGVLFRDALWAAFIFSVLHGYQNAFHQWAFFRDQSFLVISHARVH